MQTQTLTKPHQLDNHENMIQKEISSSSPLKTISPSRRHRPSKENQTDEKHTQLKQHKTKHIESKETCRSSNSYKVSLPYYGVQEDMFKSDLDVLVWSKSVEMGRKLDEQLDSVSKGELQLSLVTRSHRTHLLES